MQEVSFEAKGEKFVASILGNGLAQQHSVRQIVDGSGKALSANLVRFPFTVKLLPDDDFVILPTGSLTPENQDVLLSLVAKLSESGS